MSIVAVSPTPSFDPVADQEAFRALLVAQRADCVRQRQVIAAEDLASPGDSVITGRAADLLRTIEEIDAALERIELGTYGSCVRCGTTIPGERLEFRPYAAACVPCARSDR
ncbi:TraR/DksA family transcriptional regulator [Cryptosporangium sp. NPDC048952]|uniref:TraR/DksA family transcriptional regulator n=1 Tax=Cryptosporangium sp. NPDC048952 TaxID=3363961 RepID=UPI00371AA356